MNKQNQNIPYVILNQQQFPFLTKIRHFSQTKAHAQNQPTYDKFLIQAGPLFKKWFDFYKPDSVLIQIDNKNKNAKFYENRQLKVLTAKLTEQKLRASLFFSNFWHYNQKLQILGRKNFINGALTPGLIYSRIKYNDQVAEGQINSITQLGVKFNINKYLTDSEKTNQKKIFLIHRARNPFKKLLFESYSAEIFLANRSNYYLSTTKKPVAKSIVKKSSDIFGYKLSLFSSILGFKATLAGGYDYFQSYSYNKFLLNYLKSREFQKFILEISCSASAVFGENLMQNDLLTRSKIRWNEDRSLLFTLAQLNLILKKRIPLLENILQAAPVFYLEGCASRNTLQESLKYELDYGVRLRSLNGTFFLSYSLFRLGKNLDSINPSLRIVF